MRQEGSVGSGVSRNEENGIWHCGLTENNPSDRHPPAEDGRGNAVWDAKLL